MNLSIDLQDLVTEINCLISTETDDHQERIAKKQLSDALKQQDFPKIHNLLMQSEHFEISEKCSSTSSMVSEISYGNIEKATFHASFLFQNFDFKPYRLDNLLQLLIIGKKFFSAEYFIKYFDNQIKDQSILWKKVIIIYLALDKFVDAETFFERNINPRADKFPELVTELSSYLEQKRIKRLKIEWTQRSDQILTFKNTQGVTRKVIPVITMPKSGTHLFRNIAKQIEEVDWNIFHAYQHKPIHLMSNKSVLVIRDPRAIVLSLKNYINKASQHFEKNGFFESPSFDFMKFKEWNMLSEDEKLDAIVSDDISVLPHKSKFHRISYLEASRLMENETVYVSKFENLATLDDGNISESQVFELKGLLDFFDLHIDEDEIKNIYHKSWGNSDTFHKADPYLWKKEIPSKILEKIEAKLGFFIASWGYEI